MELQVTTLDGKKSGSVTVSDAIFGLDPRTDLIHRCVVWQLAKRQRGTHEISPGRPLASASSRTSSAAASDSASPATKWGDV